MAANSVIANAGIVKAILRFYRINSDTALIRATSIIDMNTGAEKAPCFVPWPQGIVK